MGFWAAAAPILGGVLGGIGGKSKKNQASKPTTRTILPPTELGGWGRVNEIMRGLGTAPQYRPGANNPYLSGGMAHILGRAGVPAPEGGFPNPYLNPPQQIAAASTPAPTPAPTPTPKPGIAGAKKRRDQLIKEIG